MCTRPFSLVPPFQPFRPLPKLDALVKALWRVLRPGSRCLNSYNLGCVFAQLSQSNDSQTLYVNHFDPVTSCLPDLVHNPNRQCCNLKLSCFNSWADVEKEKQRARERCQLFIPSVLPSAGFQSPSIPRYEARGATGAPHFHKHSSNV